VYSTVTEQPFIAVRNLRDIVDRLSTTLFDVSSTRPSHSRLMGVSEVTIYICGVHLSRGFSVDFATCLSSGYLSARVT